MPCKTHVFQSHIVILTPSSIIGILLLSQPVSKFTDGLNGNIHCPCPSGSSPADDVICIPKWVNYLADTWCQFCLKEYRDTLPYHNDPIRIMLAKARHGLNISKAQWTLLGGGGFQGNTCQGCQNISDLQFRSRGHILPPTFAYLHSSRPLTGFLEDNVILMNESLCKKFFFCFSGPPSLDRLLLLLFSGGLWSFYLSC